PPGKVGPLLREKLWRLGSRRNGWVTPTLTPSIHSVRTRHPLALMATDRPLTASFAVPRAVRAPSGVGSEPMVPLAATLKETVAPGASAMLCGPVSSTRFIAVVVS